MNALPVQLVCSGCGASPAPEDPWPFGCPAAGSDDVDHVLVRRLEAGSGGWPGGDGGCHPFLRYRALLRSYHLALWRGLGDAGSVEIVRGLDARVAAIAGRGFAATPFLRSPALSEAWGSRLREASI